MPGETLPDRAGAAVAHAPGRLWARLRETPAHQRGVAGAVAAVLLLVLVAGLASGGDDASGEQPPAQQGRGQDQQGRGR